MLLVFVGTQSLKPARSQARQKIAVNLVAGVYPLHRIEQLCYYKGNISMMKDNENITPSKKNGTKLFAASLRTLADLVEGTERIKLCNCHRAGQINWSHGLAINAKGQV